MNWPRILITGAAGFIGGWTAEELCRAGAANVRAGVAGTANIARITGLPVEIVRCDIMDPESLDAAMTGIEVVVHCAHSRIDESTTVEGTRLVLQRAIANGVRRVVHMSSVAVYGNVLGIVTEDTSPVPPVNPYGQRKQAAEQACRSAAGPQLTVAVLRPTLVYGPFGELWTTSYIKRILAGQLKQLGSAGEGNANLIYARDLARFAAHLAVAELPQYSVFNANGPEIPTFNEYFDRLSRMLGRGPLPTSTNSLTICSPPSDPRAWQVRAEKQSKHAQSGQPESDSKRCSKARGSQFAAETERWRNPLLRNACYFFRAPCPRNWVRTECILGRGPHRFCRMGQSDRFDEMTRNHRFLLGSSLVCLGLQILLNDGRLSL